ncbi:MAG: SDR family NAD(P)-dependent oxidoreductase [Chloroflexi bacterium]|nr:SDR family NAD(P)-dependent oxidoreductase [Chloroflexota bacterium]
MRRVDKNKFGPWAVVTGASSGIGKEFVRQLAASSINVVLVARRLELLEELGRDLASTYGIEYRAVGLDLTSLDFMVVLQNATDDLDIGLVISNAGTGIPGEFLTIDHNTLLDMVHLSVIAHLSIAHHFGDKLVKRGRGGLVLVSAMGALQGLPYMANDSATNAYIINLGEALNVELKQYGINVTVLIPGATDTPIIDKFGIDVSDMPIKPMSVEQCVDEALAALQANHPIIIPGRLNRLMYAILPRRLAVQLNGKMIARALQP